MAVIAAGNHVSGVAFNPRGDVLAVADMDRRVTLWDTVDRSAPVRCAVLEARLPEADHLGMSETAAFSRSGRLLAVAGRGLLAGLWDVSNPARPVELASITAAVGDGGYQVQFGPDDRILVTCSASEADGTGATDLWDVSSPRSPARLARIERPPSQGPGAVISPDGRLLVTAGPQEDQVLWDIRDPARPRPVANAMLNAGLIANVAFSPDSRLAVTAHGGAVDYRLRIWNMP
jgi:WD40 repeat protein